MFAATSPPIAYPTWVERIALPEYPAMPLPGYILLGIGGLLLLIGYFAPIKKILSLFAAWSLMAYYPLVYLFYWYLFRFHDKTRDSREPTKLDVFLLEHKSAVEWGILGVCVFFGSIFLIWTVSATVRKRRRSRERQTVSADNPFEQQPAVPRPVVPRPVAAPEARKVAKKPPTPPARDNPFNFG